MIVWNDVSLGGTGNCRAFKDWDWSGVCSRKSRIQGQQEVDQDLGLDLLLKTTDLPGSQKRARYDTTASRIDTNKVS